MCVLRIRWSDRVTGVSVWCFRIVSACVRQLVDGRKSEVVDYLSFIACCFGCNKNITHLGHSLWIKSVHTVHWSGPSPYGRQNLLSDGRDHLSWRESFHFTAAFVARTSENTEGNRSKPAAFTDRHRLMPCTRCSRRYSLVTGLDALPGTSRQHYQDV